LFPSLQQFAALKQVISNSSIFPEAKLSLNNPNNNNIATGSNQRSTNSALSLDLKGLIHRAILLTNNTAGLQNGVQAAVLAEKFMAKPCVPGAPLPALAAENFTESLKPLALFQGYPSDLAASSSATTSSTGSSNGKNIDVLPRQHSGQRRNYLANHRDCKATWNTSA